MSRRANIPLEGEFNCWTRDFDLPDLIFAVCEAGETGLLRFVNVEAEKTLFIRDERVIFATSSSTDDRLGEYLLRMGKVRLKVLTEIGREVRPGKRLGGLLVERGVLEPKELVDAVVGHVRAMIVSLFRWTDGWYGFTPQELPTKETITLDIPTADLILAGVRQIDSWRRILKGVGELETCYRAVPGRETVVRSMEVDARGVEILAALRAPLTVEVVCARSELHDFEVSRLLWVYRSVGLIEKVEAASIATAPGPAAAIASSSQVGAPVPEEPAASVIVEPEPVVAGVKAVVVVEPTLEVPEMSVAAEERSGEPVARLEAAVTTDDAEPHAPAEAQAHPFEVWRASCGEPVEGEPPGLDNGGVAPLAAVEAAEAEAEHAGAPPIESGDADLEGLGMVLQNDRVKTLRRPAPAPSKISTDV